MTMELDPKYPRRASASSAASIIFRQHLEKPGATCATKQHSSGGRSQMMLDLGSNLLLACSEPPDGVVCLKRDGKKTPTRQRWKNWGCPLKRDRYEAGIAASHESRCGVTRRT